MFKFVLVPVMSLILNTLSATAQASELSGICEQQNTSADCEVTNRSSSKVVAIQWLLAGSDVDYVDEVEVNLMPGKTTVITNRPGYDNCLFTKDTSVYVTTASGRTTPLHGQLQFSPSGKCTLVIR